jgi:hypothetical protein
LNHENDIALNPLQGVLLEDEYNSKEIFRSRKDLKFIHYLPKDIYVEMFLTSRLEIIVSLGQKLENCHGVFHHVSLFCDRFVSNASDT